MYDELFQSVREQTSPRIWSKGVELARSQSVSLVRELGELTELRVKTDKAATVVVKLYASDLDWQCSCGGDDDPCGHVAGAVIALRQAGVEGTPLKQFGEQGITVSYEIKTQGQLAYLERYLRKPDSELIPLPQSVASLASGRITAHTVTATSADLKIDLLIGGSQRIAPKSWHELIPALMEITQHKILCNGVPSELHLKTLGVYAVVIDDGPGVRITIKDDDSIKQVFSNGIAISTDGIHTFRIPDLTPQQLKFRGQGQFFGRQEFGDVTGRIIPELAEKMPVHGVPGLSSSSADYARNLPAIDAMLRPYMRINLDLASDYALLPRYEIVYGDPVVAIADGEHLKLVGKTSPKRDFAVERELRDEAERLNLTIQTGDAAVNLVQKLERLSVSITGKGHDFYKTVGHLTANCRVTATDLELHFNTNGHEVKSASVMTAWSSGQSYVSLADGGVAAIPKAWLDANGAKILDLLAAKGERDHLPAAARPLLLDLAEDLKEEVPPSLRHWVDVLNTGTQTTYSLPAQLDTILRPYQKDGAYWLRERLDLGVGALLADDMGLGKTLQAMSVINGKTLVVAPTSVLFNWKDELAKFRPDLTVALYHGAKRSIPANTDVLLTSYGLLRLDLEKFTASAWDLLIIDEAQNVKNPQAKASKALRTVPANARIALTGTPIENDVADLWSIMEILNPRLLGSYSFFQEKYGRPINQGDENQRQLLKKRVKPFILRRVKRDVLKDLPPRTEQTIYIELSPEERQLYEVVRAAARSDVAEKLELGGNIFSMLEALLRLRQAACHTGLVPGSNLQISSKLATLVATISERKTLNSGDRPRFLVFSQWTSLLDFCEPAFNSAAITFTRLDGQTTNRERIVNEFQDPNGPDVLLISLKAGGVGLNLTQADHVFILDPWWNPAGEEQAADRAHRIGQERPVLVQRFVALDTVEEGVMTLKAAKRAVAGAIVDGETADSKMSRQDLLNLIG